MRAVRFHQFGDLDVLQVDEVPIPEPGPGQIRIAVRAVGVNPADWKVIEGELGGDLPLGVGIDAAGVVDALGEGVTDVAVGDAVVGVTSAGLADFAVLLAWVPIPEGLDVVAAAALPLAAETATRGIDLLGVGAGTTLLINGAAGAVGSIATQLSVLRGARVIATASERNAGRLRGYGAEPTTYGPGLAERVAQIAPDGVDVIFDMAPPGALPELVAIAGTPDRVLTVSDFETAPSLGVRVSGREGTEYRWDAIGTVVDLAAEGKLELPVERTFPFEEFREAERISKAGHVTGKLVVVID